MLLAAEFPPLSHITNWSAFAGDGQWWEINKVVIVYGFAVLFTVLLFTLGNKKKLVPTGAQNLAEMAVEFVEDGIALRTEDPDQLRAAADAFGADYEVSTNDEGEIEVSHTGELYAVDQNGTVVMQWPFGTDFESTTRDIRSLLAEAQASA